MTERKLTAKQERFCLEYLRDLNATKAAIRAGYSKKSANEIGAQNLAKLSISEEIDRLKAERVERTHIDNIWVLKRLIQISNRCMQAEEIFDQEGNPTGVYRFDAAGAVRATELIGKHIGFFEADNKQKTPDMPSQFYRLPDGTMLEFR
jgi:phage terminase small subunit